MPRVPTYDNYQVGATALPLVPVSDAGAAQAAQQTGRQAQQMGAATEQLGGAASNIAVDLQDQANQVQVNNAANAARRAQLDLTFDPNNGYRNLKGDAALTRPNGQALPDEYADKFKETLNTIGDGLGNDAQKRAFALQSNDMLTSFKGDVEAHMLGEFRNHAMSVQQGTISVSADTAKLNWNSPDKIGPAIESARAAVYQAGAIAGESATETAAKMKVTTSAIHTGVVSAALENNNPEYALAYLERNKDGMTADDLLRARGVINRDVYARGADGTATNVVQGMRAQLQPTDADRMINITTQAESGGNRDAVGRFVPGQGTAKGEMQVMDATAANPGHGIKPEDPTIPGDRGRVGRELLGQLAVKYAGDPAKAWAAYNAGEGNVDKAIADAKGGDWLSALGKYQSADNHQETVNYVTKNVAALQAGGGAPVRPTLQDVHDQIRAKITAQYGTTPPMGVLSAALQAGEKQWEDLNKSITAQGDQVYAQAQRELISNGGDFTKLAPSTRAAVAQYAPGHMDDLALFARRISSAGETETNMAAYNAAVTYPEELAKMTDAQFLHFQTVNFSTADQAKIAKMRADEISNPDNSAGGINNKAFNTSFNYRAEAMGVPVPKPSDSVDAKAHFGTLQKAARDSIYDAQQQLGRKMTAQEISDHLDSLFAKNVTFRNSFAGIDYSTSTQPLLSLKIGDLPGDTRDALRASFAKRGVANPSDSDMLAAYLKWKTNAKQ